MHEHAVRGHGRRRDLQADPPARLDDAPLGHEETAGEPGDTGSITLEHAECLAACDLGPVIQVNYEFYDNQTVDSATELVTRCGAARSRPRAGVRR